MNSLSDESTPYKPNNQSTQKFAGGLLVQDLIIGRGPEATKGKTVSQIYLCN